MTPSPFVPANGGALPRPLFGEESIVAGIGFAEGDDAASHFGNLLEKETEQPRKIAPGEGETTGTQNQNPNPHTLACSLAVLPTFLEQPLALDLTLPQVSSDLSRTLQEVVPAEASVSDAPAGDLPSAEYPNAALDQRAPAGSIPLPPPQTFMFPEPGAVATSAVSSDVSRLLPEVASAEAFSAGSPAGGPPRAELPSAALDERVPAGTIPTSPPQTIMSPEPGAVAAPRRREAASPSLHHPPPDAPSPPTPAPSYSGIATIQEEDAAAPDIAIRGERAVERPSVPSLPALPLTPGKAENSAGEVPSSTPRTGVVETSIQNATPPANPDGQRLSGRSRGRGIAVAKASPDMNFAESHRRAPATTAPIAGLLFPSVAGVKSEARQLFPARPTHAASAPDGTNQTRMPLVVEIGSPMAGNAHVSAPRAEANPARLREQTLVIFRAVHEVATVSRAPGRMELELHLADGERLQVRIEMKAGELKTTFEGASPELRNALERGWADFTLRSADRGLRLGEATFRDPLGENSGFDEGSKRDLRHEDAEAESYRGAKAAPQRPTSSPQDTPAVQRTPGALSLWA